MLLCACPDPKEMHKTLCTLEYGAKAKCIVRGSLTLNRDMNGDEDISELNEGTVSSVAPREYFDGTYKLLSIEIDNDRCYCSGPVVMRDMIVGSNKKLWNCIIPTPVIKYFLNGLEERHIGFSLLDIRYQTLEDAQLRRHFKMSHDMTGVLITEIDPLSNAFKVLKKHDVILAIEDLPVDNDRTVHFQRKEYLSLNHLVSMKKPGEVASLKILRNGKEHAYNVSLNFTKQQLVPYKFIPSYYILGRS